MHELARAVGSLPPDIGTRYLRELKDIQKKSGYLRGIRKLSDVIHSSNHDDFFDIQSVDDARHIILLASNINLDKNLAKPRKEKAQGMEVSGICLKDAFSTIGFECLKEEGVIERHLKLAFRRSTHLVKFNDNFGKSIDLCAPLLEETTGITQYHARTGRGIYNQGAASDMPYQRVFTMLVKYKGTTGMIADHVAAGAPELLEAISKLGIEKDRLKGLVSLAQNAARVSDIQSAPGRQLLWPIYTEEGEQFIALSPVPSIRVYESIASRSAQVKAENPWHILKTEEISVGGSKPQNFGGYANMIQGRLLGLTASIPTIRQSSTLIEKVREGRHLLRFMCEESEGLYKQVNHFKQRSSYAAAAKEYVSAVLGPVLEYKALRREDEDLPLPRQPLEKLLVTAEFKYGEPETVACQLTNATISRNKRDDKPFTAYQIDTLNSVFAQFIREFFKD